MELWILSKENKFKILAYNPIMNKENICVDTGAWLKTRTVFENSKDSSTAIISREDYYLNKFYSTLSPDNMLEFLKDCFE